MERHRVDREPPHPHDDEEAGEQQQSRCEPVSRLDELWQQREEEDRHLRIQDVREDALSIGSPRIGHVRSFSEGGFSAGSRDRPDPEEDQVRGAGDLHDRERLR
jgi:hypothetical protein